MAVGLETSNNDAVMKIYLATWFEDWCGRHLTRADIEKRLVSYYKLESNDFLRTHFRQYAKTGRMPATKREVEDAGQSC